LRADKFSKHCTAQTHNTPVDFIPGTTLTNQRNGLLLCINLVFYILLAMRVFIESNFKLLDIDSDGIVVVKEYNISAI